MSRHLIDVVMMLRHWHIFAFPSLADVLALSRHCCSVKTFSTQCHNIGNLMSRHWPFFCTMLIFAHFHAEFLFFSLIS